MAWSVCVRARETFCASSRALLAAAPVRADDGPTLRVVIRHPAAPPSEVEETLALPVEKELVGLEGLTSRKWVVLGSGQIRT